MTKCVHLNMENSITWGIIGCGNVTEMKSGPAFNKVPGSRLHAVMRRDAALAKDYAQRHGVPVWYSNTDDLLNDSVINAIYIATPPKFHEEYTIAALEKGKMVYVEKPVTLDSASCIRMMEAQARCHGKVVVAHYRRALPMFNHIRQLVEKQAVGRIKLIKLTMFKPNDHVPANLQAVNWRVDPQLAGGGYFYDLAPHQLDIIQYIFGIPEKVAGLSARQAGIYPAEDAVVCQFQLPGDIQFQGSWNFSMSSLMREDSCQLIGENGYIQFPFFGQEVRVVTDQDVQHLPFQHPQHIQQPMIEKVVNHFLGKADNPCPLEEAIHSLKVMETCVGR
jgi:predicted dehydrogenase